MVNGFSFFLSFKEFKIFPLLFSAIHSYKPRGRKIGLFVRVFAKKMNHKQFMFIVHEAWNQKNDFFGILPLGGRKNTSLARVFTNANEQT